MKLLRQCYTFYANSACRQPAITLLRLPSRPRGVRHASVLHKGKEIPPLYEVIGRPKFLRRLVRNFYATPFATLVGTMTALFWSQEVKPQTEDEKKPSPRYELRPPAERVPLMLVYIFMGCMVMIGTWRRTQSIAHKVWVIPKDVRGKDGVQDTIVMKNFAKSDHFVRYTCPRNTWGTHSENPKMIILGMTPPGRAYDCCTLALDDNDHILIHGKPVPPGDARRILLDYLENPHKLEAAIASQTSSGSGSAKGKK